MISAAELSAIFDLKYRQVSQLGPDPARRLSYGYYNPDDHYEALVRRLVTERTRWLDVGCGRDLFPSNRALAAELAQRCGELVGVDPDDTLHENPFVHRKIQGYVQDIDTDEQFDLVTFRMVAEHVTDPPVLLAALRKLVAPAGQVVIYTVNRFSPVPLITALTPFALHNPVKYLLWRTDAKDTFPTAFKMNTRATLKTMFEQHGFEERGFCKLDDCRTFQRFRVMNVMELELRSFLHRFNLHYPENCLLGLYQQPWIETSAPPAATIPA